jgi:hypothetical protein
MRELATAQDMAPHSLLWVWGLGFRVQMTWRQPRIWHPIACCRFGVWGLGFR